MDLCCTLDLVAGGCFWCQFGADVLALQSLFELSGAQDMAKVLCTQPLIPSRATSNPVQNPLGILCFWR